MADRIIENRVFEKLDPSEKKLNLTEYDGCTFNRCNFLNSDLSHSIFLECTFNDCDLSMSQLKNTSLKDVTFKNCKLLGLDFSDCNQFLLQLSFTDCNLNLALFYQLKLKGTKFKNCSLHEADFTETDLTSSVFDNCDFTRAVFGNTVLEKSDLRTSYNYSIDPEINRIKKAKFSVHGAIGLLDRYDIHIE
ncbi:pentapeptide repeat-containing protein [Reichenbachiella sp. MALMAid0571]|uniref:pentapeptide repeat-containing protein n=1 Tax=Reichenbachiella sp. MALMAid0571 TaxID=3143939 RepID=UPI0032DFE8BA